MRPRGVAPLLVGALLIAPGAWAAKGATVRASPASGAPPAPATTTPTYAPPPAFPDLVLPPDAPPPTEYSGEPFVFRWPLDRVVITSHFGARKRPGKKKSSKRFHGATDMDGDLGEAVRASGPGRVAHAGWFFGYGNLVVLNHHGRFQTLYGHLSEVHVFVGEMVRSGATLGLVGSTGTSTGTHLHFGVAFKGRPIDPEEVVGMPSDAYVPPRDEDDGPPAKRAPPRPKKGKKP